VGPKGRQTQLQRYALRLALQAISASQAPISGPVMVYKKPTSGALTGSVSAMRGGSRTARCLGVIRSTRVGTPYRLPASRHGRGTQPESGTQRERCCRTSPLPSTEADRRACNRRRDSCCRGTSRRCRRPAARREAGTQLSCRIFNARRAWHEARPPLKLVHARQARPIR